MNETRTRPRVYIVEQQPFDYSPAEAFGELRPMDIQKLAPHASNLGVGWNSRVLHQIKRELGEYVPGIDFIIPTGAPQKLMAVGVVLAGLGEWHNVLGWDARTGRYLHYILPIK